MQDLCAIVVNDNLTLAGLKHYGYYSSQTIYYPYANSVEETIKNDLQSNNLYFRLEQLN
ncbi:MAG: hypothetical protein WAT43_11445 [Chitinophagales bacterium]